MDFRNEYRIKPSTLNQNYWEAEFRSLEDSGFFFHSFSWSDWKFVGIGRTPEEAENLCRIHAGEFTKYLGRLP